MAQRTSILGSRGVAVVVSVLSATMTAPGSVAASGLEVPEIGGIAMGRAGAMVARPGDPTTMVHNPAGMVALPGFQVTAGSNLGYFNQCFQRAGAYASSNDVSINTAGTVFETSMYANPSSGVNTPYPRVCNNPALALGPNFLMTYRILPNLSIGIGVYPPSSTGREGIYDDRVQTINGLAPSPVRHMLYEKRLLLLYPTLSVAYAPVPWLRFGGGFSVGYGNFEYSTHLSPLEAEAQSPDGDVKLTLNASGMFFAGNVGAQVLLPNYFTFGVKAQINPTVDFNGVGSYIDRLYAANPMSRATGTFNIDHLRASLPWHVRAGVRFALPRPGSVRPYDAQNPVANTRANAGNFQRSYDPMRDDVFDIEADFNFERTSTLSDTLVEASGTIVAAGLMVGAPSRIELKSNFRDTFGVRVGGDYNVIPDRFALRAGFSFESGAQTAMLSQLHLPSYDSVSAHLGASVRFSWFTASVAYGHYFFMPIDDPMGNRYIITTRAISNPSDPCPASAGRAGACMVNAGQYNASFDSASIQLSGRW